MNTGHRSIPHALLAVAVFASSLPAQSTLPRKEMVKVEIASGEIIRGRVLRSTRDSLRLSDYSRVLVIPAADIISVATYDRHWMKGSARGARTGAIVGAATIAAGLVVDLTTCRKPGSECMVPATAVGVGAAFYSTLIGAGLGLLAAPGGWNRPQPYGSR